MKTKRRINIKLEEIPPFLDSLSTEREFFRDTLANILIVEFVYGARVGEELAGIGYVFRNYKFLVGMGIVIGNQFQGRGLGNEIMGEIISYAREKYSYLITAANHKNTRAINLYRKCGFEFLYDDGIKDWLYMTFNKNGERYCGFLRLILKCSFWIYKMTPPARYFVPRLHNWYWKFRTPRILRKQNNKG